MKAPTARISHRSYPMPLRALPVLALVVACAPASPADRPVANSDQAYFAYVSQAPELRPVRRVPARRWDTWLYMPWRYRWAIGTGEEGGRFCRELGINGGVSDHGQGPLPWLERWGLRFYNDHTAGKGALYLEPGGLDSLLRDPRAVRPRPLGPALLAELETIVSDRVRALRQSPQRVAYALDDETSWGSFTRPAVWRIEADDTAYRNWLARYYGGLSPPARWVSPDDVFGELKKPLREIDLFAAARPDDLQRLPVGEFSGRAGGALQPGGSGDSLRRGGCPGAEPLGRLRLRQAGEEGPIHRGLRRRLGPGDPPLLRPRQRRSPGVHPFPRRAPGRGQRRLARLAPLRPRRPGNDRLGRRGLVRRRPPAALARPLPAYPPRARGGPGP